MTIKEEIALETVRSVNEPLSVVFNEDCMEGMKRYPDKYFDLAVVDPPYGIGRDNQKLTICKNPKHNRKQHLKKDWDSEIPSANYFQRLETVTASQVIWGANYFVKYLSKATKGWVIWYKGQQGLSMSDAEIAYTSFNQPTRVITLNRVELLKEGTIHPTQKPVKLYEWILLNYAKPGDKILDTHVGSGSSRIAAYKHGFDYVGFEIDKDYFEAQEKRFNEFKAQLTLF